MAKTLKMLSSTMPAMRKAPSLTESPGVYGHNTSAKLGKPQGAGLPCKFVDTHPRLRGQMRKGK